jgi:hypothetical protein
MGIFGNREQRQERKETKQAAKEEQKSLEASALATFGPFLALADRLEVLLTARGVTTSNNLTEQLKHSDRVLGDKTGWRVMPYTPGMEVEVLTAESATADSSRVTASRVLAMGVFALAAKKKKKKGAPAKALFVLGNEEGQTVIFEFDVVGKNLINATLAVNAIAAQAKKASVNL